MWKKGVSPSLKACGVLKDPRITPQEVDSECRGRISHRYLPLERALYLYGLWHLINPLSVMWLLLLCGRSAWVCGGCVPVVSPHGRQPAPRLCHGSRRADRARRRWASWANGFFQLQIKKSIIVNWLKVSILSLSLFRRLIRMVAVLLHYFKWPTVDVLLLNLMFLLDTHDVMCWN